MTRALEVEAPAQNSKEQLVAEISELRQQIASSETALLRYRQQHFVTVNGTLVMLGRPEGADHLREGYLTLQRAHEALLIKWHAVLAEHAALISPARRSA